MTWTLYRWIWRVKSPLYVSMHPAGVLTRCRLYVPAHTLWGAVTNELGKQEVEYPAGNKFESSEEVRKYYRQIGDYLKEDTRFSYLYPAEQVNGQWKAWLPCYQVGQGLCWLREDEDKENQVDKEYVSHRAFRSRLLYTRLSTAIERKTGTAADETLHETECLQPFWRGSGKKDVKSVAMVGYVFIKDDALLTQLEKINDLLVGADTRYGLGHLNLEVKLEKSEQLFNLKTNLSQGEIRISLEAQQAILGHTVQECGIFSGALEAMGCWDMHQGQQSTNHLYWSPGSLVEDRKELTITLNGEWKSPRRLG